ncbi:MAG: threonine--tRNA ligase [Candidatus Micrarchaeaceae archaeon]
MKVLQIDAEYIEYVPLKPESSYYEPAKSEKVRIEDALVLFIAIEEGDDEKYINQAINDSVVFAKKQGLNKIVLYPFSHLSNNLEEPRRAMELFEKSKAIAKGYGLEIYSSPFGWNKKLSISTKSHPLAEQLRYYGSGEAIRKKEKRVDYSIVKKSEWSNLSSSDHRTIGEKQELFSFQEVSPGMVYWHPAGYTIFLELIRYIREKLNEYGYKEISTPAFANVALWHVSGHFEHYKDNMFIFENEGEDYGLKPMNCPSTILIYKSRKWSYKDLPLRLADFDKLYRNEISGSLTGLFRVRELTQDDAHIFVKEDQLEEEMGNVLKMIKELYSKFNLEYKAKLSTMPDRHIGSEEMWSKATGMLKNVLSSNKMDYEIKEKEGAFYGPKIDFDVKDSLGREWQCATVQLDYQLPQRFNLTYTGEDGREHTPIIIHRVIYGSLERFIGILLEHYKGKLPVWLSPIQAMVATISEKSVEYGKEVYGELLKSGIRAEKDFSDRTINYKIMEAKLKEVPYVLVVGEKEAKEKKVAVRKRSGEQSTKKLEEFVDEVKKEIEGRL